MHNTSEEDAPLAGNDQPRRRRTRTARPAATDSAASPRFERNSLSRRERRALAGQAVSHSSRKDRDKESTRSQWRSTRAEEDATRAGKNVTRAGKSYPRAGKSVSRAGGRVGRSGDSLTHRKASATRAGKNVTRAGGLGTRTD